MPKMADMCKRQIISPVKINKILLALDKINLKLNSKNSKNRQFSTQLKKTQQIYFEPQSTNLLSTNITFTRIKKRQFFAIFEGGRDQRRSISPLFGLSDCCACSTLLGHHFNF